MGSLNDPNFWSSASASAGTLQTDGSLNYVLLDKSYRMMPLIRKSETTFLDFIARDGDAKKCSVIVNGNFYGLNRSGKISVLRGNPDDPDDTEIQGRVIRNGAIAAGDSRPQSFWFGQISAFTGDSWHWYYVAEQGDPPVNQSTFAAIGGVGPLIAGASKYGTCSGQTLNYGVGNRYKPGAPPWIFEPTEGEPPKNAKPYLIQRNNNTFKSAESHPIETGKTILAYCSWQRMLLVAVQENGATPGVTYSSLATALDQRGFDAAVFLDGSDSATLVVGGKVIVKPGDRKNNSIDVGVGFYR